ncbi:hypothetical protein V6N11_076339 [Hibiscus sabdariffa]|uniref:Polygalacturonase n=1 Tax=Hibiscus sabdariffa TaxID=183260 RepID=A0ABR2Q6I6_9ROSI
MFKMCKVNPAYVVAFLTFLLFWFSSFEVTCGAREDKHRRESVVGGSRRQKATARQYTGSSTTATATATSTFNVLDYGAKGDGRTDDTKAFEATWAVACKVEASTVMVPSGSLDGKMIAPTSSHAWGSGILQWIEFTKLKGITIRGKGTIDGQGSVWWNHSPTTKPTALRFYGSDGVTVTGITIQNSPQTHLKFDDCTSVQVSNFVASSPGGSPNTDGIHLQNSRDVVISATSLACGHGISIGGLGKDNTKACVSNITVRDVTIQNTLTGVRIKTWQGGSGSVKQVTFSNVQVSEVETPIMIDQFYCDKGHCKNQSSAVEVSGINYVNIRGTYTVQPVHFACSDSLPCSGVSLSSIELKPVQESHHVDGPFCWEAYGDLKTTTQPPISCLETGKPSKAGTQSNSESC